MRTWQKAMTARLVAFLFLSIGLARTASAAEIIPALIYSHGGPFDKGFNQAAWDGAQSFRAQSGLYTRGYETGSRRSQTQAMEAAIADGADILIAMGFSSAEAVNIAAASYPHLRFVLIDAVVDRPNVLSVLFNDAEGGALAGMAAALASNSRTVAFLGAMDIPTIRRFETGFRDGVNRIDPAITVLSEMAGSSPAAFDDPFTGYRLAMAMLDPGGADVIFAAAGTTGLGALQAASDTQTRAIGVDTDQNDLFPGIMLGSVLKRVDLAVHDILMDAWRGNWQAGTRHMGIKDGGLAIQLSPTAATMIGSDAIEALDALVAGIASGEITIPADHVPD